MTPHLSCLSIAERSGSGLEVSSLTRDDVVATLEVVDNTLSCLCGCAITKAGEGKPLPFESAMAELLLVGWAKASRGAVEVAMKGLAARAGEITNKEIKGILTGIEMQIEAKFVKPTGNGLPKLITGAYKKAKGDVMRKHKRRLMMAAFDDDAMQWLNDHHMYWVGSYYNRFLSERIAKTIKDGMVEGLGREAIGGKLKRFFDKYPGIQSKPEVYWRGMAANGMNRSRNFGLISGYQDVGVKQLRVLAVIDERTSPICFAPWTPIAVERGHKRIDRISPGDKVLTGSGSYHVVKSTSSRTSHIWIIIKLSSGNLLTVTPEHPILTIEGWKSAGQLLKGDQIALQKSSNDNLQKLRQGICKGSISGAEVLFSQVLLRRQEQECVGHSDLRELRQGVSSETLLCREGTGTKLQPGMSGYGSPQRFESCIANTRMQSLRQEVSDKTNRISLRQDQKTLLNRMSETARHNDMRSVWQGIRIQLVRKGSPQVLFLSLLSQSKVGVFIRIVGRRDTEGIRNRVQIGNSIGEFLDRLRSAQLQYSHRGGWGILAQKQQKIGIQEKKRGFHNECRLRFDKTDGERFEKRTGENSVEEYLCSSSSLSTVISIQRIHLPAGLPAYNLEIDNDPTYIANDVIVHNCREMNGKIIPVARAANQRDAMMAAESPEDVKTISPWRSVKEITGLSTAKIMDKGMVMPPFHFHCRTTVVEE